MAKLSDIPNSNHPQKVLVFGSPKTGKTQLIGELSKEFNLIWFDIENGADTLLKLPMDQKERIELISIQDTIEQPRAHATIDKIIKGGDFRICDDHGSVECPFCTKNMVADRWSEIHIPTSIADGGANTIVVIDSLSQLTTSINSTCNKHLNSSITIDWAPSRKDKDSMAEYEFQMKYLNRIMSSIQNAPFHVACTAHEIEAEREDGSVKIVPSIGSKNYAINSAKYFGHVIYMDKINLQHKAFSDTGYSNRILTGSRTDVALEGMEQMSLLPIFRGESGVGRASRKQQAAVTLGNVTNSINNANSGTAPAKPTFTLGAKK